MSGEPQIDMAKARDVWHEMERRVPNDGWDEYFSLQRQWSDAVVGPISDWLRSEDPGLPSITAFVMAQDLGGAVRADILLEDGKPWKEALWTIGSYGRCEWVKRHIKSGDVSQEEVYPLLPDLWRGSDPDDTDPWWSMMWADAWEANGRVPILDGGPLPERSWLEVYRGQIGEAALGVSWSLDEKVARRFAMTGGGRFARAGGVVLKAEARRHSVFAYLTERGEQEVIVPPTALRHVETVARVVSE
jgi:hypothetical protein